LRDLQIFRDGKFSVGRFEIQVEIFTSWIFVARGPGAVGVCFAEIVKLRGRFLPIFRQKLPLATARLSNRHKKPLYILAQGAIMIASREKPKTKNLSEP
jgi:hypothetical protein